MEMMSQQESSLAGSVNRQVRTLGEAAESIRQEEIALEARATAASQAIASAVEQLRAEKDHLLRITSEVAGGTKALQKQFGGLEASLSSASEQAAMVVARAGEDLSRRGEQLARAATEVEERLTTLTIAEQTHRQKAALDRSTFIIEALHSLSIDVSRGLDDEPSEALWKRYLKGERHVFTRRILSDAERYSERTIAARLKEDSELRTQVLRYTGQFSTMLERAANEDRDELLITTLLSSDAGKLYQLLVAALGDNT